MGKKQKFYVDEFVVTSFSSSKKISDSCKRLYNGNVTIRHKEHDGAAGHEKMLSSKHTTFKVFELNRGIVKIDGVLAGTPGCWDNSDVYLGWGYCPDCRDVKNNESSAKSKKRR